MIIDDNCHKGESMVDDYFSSLRIDTVIGQGIIFVMNRSIIFNSPLIDQAIFSSPSAYSSYPRLQQSLDSLTLHSKIYKDVMVFGFENGDNKTQFFIAKGIGLIQTKHLYKNTENDTIPVWELMKYHIN